MVVRWPVALKENGTRVWIHDDCEEQLYCPECTGEMISVRGEQYEHHFRHSIKSNCPGSAEAAMHYAKKYEIADALDGLGSVRVEGKIGNYVADVLFEGEWAFEVVITSPPSPEKLRDLGEKMVVFNFADESVWDPDAMLGTFFHLDTISFAEIVARLGRSILSGETVEACSVCREVKGAASRLKAGGRCFACDFDIFVKDREKEKEIQKGARQYRDAKMR